MVYIQEKTHQQSVHRVSSLVDGCSLDGYGMTTISPGLLPNISINCTFIALLTFHCKGNLFFPVSETLKFQGIHLISWYISKTRSFKEYRVFWAGLMKNRVSEKIPTNCWVLASLGAVTWVEDVPTCGRSVISCEAKPPEKKGQKTEQKVDWQIYTTLRGGFYR